MPQMEAKNRQLGRVSWILDTTGSEDAAELRAELDMELKRLLSDPKIYQQLLAWDQDPALFDSLLKRQLNVLIRAFTMNQIPEALLEKIAQKEARLLHTYGNFRAKFDGEELSENSVRQRLKEEQDPFIRKGIWDASKAIGGQLAPQVLELIYLRNAAAKALGYSDYFTMQLHLQEVEEEDLFALLKELEELSEEAYSRVLAKIKETQASRFSVEEEEGLAPWFWSEPFSQTDPIESSDLDALVSSADVVAASKEFYDRMGIDVTSILERSDLFERPGKNQHAFCTNIDRKADVRTLSNVRPTMNWLETVLHELGHAVYELGFDPQLPWLMREPPHMITTEAMALIAGRRAYMPEVLCHLSSYEASKDVLIQKAWDSLQRRQLIFSRWVLVMTYFERELYKNPEQDLNRLWWNLVHKYQKIPIPLGREGKGDWASKYHISLAPVYYYSYLLGELFASAIEEKLGAELGTPASGEFLQSKLFAPGNARTWEALIQEVTGEPLSSKAWARQFACLG